MRMNEDDFIIRMHESKIEGVSEEDYWYDGSMPRGITEKFPGKDVNMWEITSRKNLEAIFFVITHLVEILTRGQGGR